jgi:hypothetical protein
MFAIAAMINESLCSNVLHAAEILFYTFPGVPLCYTPGYKDVAPTEL